MSETIVPIRRALISVFDKRGLDRAGAGHWPRPARSSWPAAATGQRSSAAGLDVTEVADYTGQPEVLGGRVKTLHPKIHGGILARRDEPEDLATLERQGFLPIDLVVVNLYPFEATSRVPTRPGPRRSKTSTSAGPH